MRIFVLGTLLLSWVLQAEQKIGVVDLERAINEVEEGKEAKTKLQGEFKKKQDLLDKRQNKLKKLQDQIQTQAITLTEEARQQKAMEFQQEVAEAQQLYATMQQDMVKRQQEVMGTILKKMNPIVEDIAKKEGYTLILNKSEATVLYIQPGLDLTHTVTERYNGLHPLSVSKPKKK
ncbi:MAG: OmpH family outer membrane protein [Myxococcaceae bacterium]|nr:OmpH family outer membrane protein [Myxococcaceae bacterium]MBH2005935.1 OmpH family outer membrane protein [Myxococcaceae bacterium]